VQVQQQQPVLGHQQQHAAQQPAPHYGFPAPPAGPLGLPAVAADSPSSLLLPPVQGNQSQQQQHPAPDVPADVGQDKCKRLAEVLLKCGKPADASAWAQAALSTDPWNVDLLLLRGRALEAAGNIPGAHVCRGTSHCDIMRHSRGTRAHAHQLHPGSSHCSFSASQHLVGSSTCRLRVAGVVCWC
jgi:hypothetical protein